MENALAVTPWTRFLSVLLLALLLPLRGAWAWVPPTPVNAPEPACALHAAAQDAGAEHASQGDRPANTLCHATAGACCLAVLPSIVAGVPGSQPIASLRYPALALPPLISFGDPQERPPRSV